VKKQSQSEFVKAEVITGHTEGVILCRGNVQAKRETQIHILSVIEGVGGFKNFLVEWTE
jgi:hypothetical protein